MAQFETWLKSDLNSPPIIQTIKGNVFSSDNQGNLVGVEVYHDGEPVALVGTVSGYIIRDDGATVIVSGTVDGNKASIIMPEAAYVCPGPIGIAIRLTNGTSRVVLGACRGIVYRTSTEHIVDPSHEIPDIDELLAQLVAIRAATSAANTATANANAAASSANTKAGLANTAAGAANTAAGNANAAAGAANSAAAKIDGMTVEASLLPAGSAPTATVAEVSGHKHVSFGIPKGDKGETGLQGEKGEQGDPPSAEQVQSAVNNYLDGVITNPDSPPLDRNLASPSAAAPADMVGDLKNASTLLEEIIPDTVQTITFDGSGNVQRITHARNGTAVRTDVFTFAASTITEVRTLATGESLTIVTNTDTLETTTTYADAA